MVSDRLSDINDHFHLGMEAFCDSVVFSETPHADDLLRPGGEGPSELRYSHEAGTETPKAGGIKSASKPSHGRKSK